MTNLPNSLELPLRIAAAMQLTIAVLNLALNRMMGWRDDLARMPLLLREVHQVHTRGLFPATRWEFSRH